MADNSTDRRPPTTVPEGSPGHEGYLPFDEDAAEGPPSREGFKYTGEAKTAEQFTEYVQEYNFGGIKPDYIVLHHTAIPGASYAPFPGKEHWDANEDGKSDEQVMAQRKRKLDNIKSYYAGLGWDRGPHLFVDDRYIWLFTPMYEVGYHAKEGNMIGDDIELPKHYSIGIEVVGYYEHVQWPPQVEQLVRHAVTTLQKRLGTFELQLVYPNGRKQGDPLKWGGIASHRNYNKKECPGAAITEQYYMGVLRSEL